MMEFFPLRGSDMPMLSDFFRDYGAGNFYQGTAQNTSGQMFDPLAYGGAGKFDPKNPNNLNNIGPKSFSTNPYQMASPLGSWGAQNIGPQRNMQRQYYPLQQGQGVQSPQSGYSYTLADLLRTYYQ